MEVNLVRRTDTPDFNIIIGIKDGQVMSVDFSEMVYRKLRPANFDVDAAWRYLKDACNKIFKNQED